MVEGAGESEGEALGLQLLPDLELLHDFDDFGAFVVPVLKILAEGAGEALGLLLLTDFGAFEDFGQKRPLHDLSLRSTPAVA